PDALFLVARRIDDVGAGFELARVNTAEGDRADKRVVHDLEAEQRQRIGIRRMADLFLFGVRIDALDRRNIDRRGQIIDDRVEQRLYALVLERRAAQHGEERAVQNRLADKPLQRRLVRLLAVEIGFHRRVVEFDRRLDEL